jgi:hypothetical protein
MLRVSDLGLRRNCIPVKGDLNLVKPDLGSLHITSLPIMKLLALLSVALTARLVAGHAYVWGIAVNGKDQGRGDAVPGYVRKIFDNNPVKDVKSQDMTCNRNKGVNSQTVTVNGGDKVRNNTKMKRRNYTDIAIGHYYLGSQQPWR